MVPPNCQHPRKERPYQRINPPWSLKRLEGYGPIPMMVGKTTSNYDDGQTQIFDHKENGGTLGMEGP